MSVTPSSSGEPQLPVARLHDEITHLTEAITSQRAIGMAVGLLSAKYGCSTEQAWRTMVRVSQDSNTKVRTVARILVAIHDGAAGPEDFALLSTFEGQLPASGWAGGSPA